MIQRLKRETYEEAGWLNALLNGHSTAALPLPGLRHLAHLSAEMQTHEAKTFSSPVRHKCMHASRHYELKWHYIMMMEAENYSCHIALSTKKTKCLRALFSCTSLYSIEGTTIWALHILISCLLWIQIQLSEQSVTMHSNPLLIDTVCWTLFRYSVI